MSKKYTFEEVGEIVDTSREMLLNSIRCNIELMKNCDKESVLKLLDKYKYPSESGKELKNE